MSKRTTTARQRLTNIVADGGENRRNRFGRETPLTPTPVSGAGPQAQTMMIDESCYSWSTRLFDSDTNLYSSSNYGNSIATSLLFRTRKQRAILGCDDNTSNKGE
mmetsp:Transcript_107/g.165  ORF Transcript_107/g.165 Transcript_107/m.165 type:complete len:105 (-) Transcript_107:126-440(-)